MFNETNRLQLFERYNSAAGAYMGSRRISTVGAEETEGETLELCSSPRSDRCFTIPSCALLTPSVITR